MQLSQVSRRNYEGYFMHPNIYYSPSKIILLFVLWKNSGELKIINTNKTNPFYALDKRTKKRNYVIIKEITHSYFFSSKYKPFFNCYLVLTPKDWNNILEFNIVGGFFSIDKILWIWLHERKIFEMFAIHRFQHIFYWNVCLFLR